MDKDKLKDYFEHTSPSDNQKSRMRQAILSQQHSTNSVPKRKWRWGMAKVSAIAISLMFVLFLLIYTPFGGKSVVYGINIIDPSDSIITLEDYENVREDLGTSVSMVNSRPDLDFYIDGEDIAQIEITTNNEYITAHDWTETQHEKYWNNEYSQYFDEEYQQLANDFDLIYDKKLTMTFDEDFTDYDEIWFNWGAQDLHKWAAADDFAHFLGYGIKLDDVDAEDINFDELSEEEKLELAAGEGSGMGHIQLDGYPEHLLEDIITITITDHDGHETIEKIHVSISNNMLRQTVVTATLLD